MSEPASESSLLASAPENDEASPRRVASLASRSSPLAPAAEQLRLLARVPLTRAGGSRAEFDDSLADAGLQDGLRPARIDTLQVNVGKLCNMACAHCHVDAGPDRLDAMMDRATADACLRALDLLIAGRGPEGARSLTVDITGGAPELSPQFTHLVDECARRGVHVIDRCNLTVLLLPRFAGLPGWLGERGVELACSLPHHRRPSTDAQRGAGAWEKSMEALRLLNAAGYGQGDPRRRLTLVSNPAGAFLAPDQGALEREWKGSLAGQGVTFDRLIALNNMPIARFLEWLQASGNLEAYLGRLVAAFNPATLDGLMCRTTLSVSWDGRLFDCDFNQMLDLGLDTRGARGEMTIHTFDPSLLAGRRIRTARHCFGCTAGAGSSCGGALDASPRQGVSTP